MHQDIFISVDKLKILKESKSNIIIFKVDGSVTTNLNSLDAGDVVYVPEKIKYGWFSAFLAVLKAISQARLQYFHCLQYYMRKNQHWIYYIRKIQLWISIYHCS